MMPYFGASVYDDPAVYAKMSAINFIRQVKTPTLVVVGERDRECPAPQNEGHAFHTPAHQKDVLVRMIARFNENLK